jgi:Fe-S-cluster containining protein
MPAADFECKQCGYCCLNLNAHYTCVGEDDIRLWEKAGRTDILEWVYYLPIGRDDFVYDIWFNPKTGEEVRRCPWLRKLPKKNKYVCRIHDVKPRLCREYPKSRRHAEESGCKVFS